MCLATIYGKKQEDETILLKNASRIDVDGTTIRIRDIMGMEITVEGHYHGGPGKLGCKDQLCRQLNSMKGYNNQAVDTV